MEHTYSLEEKLGELERFLNINRINIALISKTWFTVRNYPEIRGYVVIYHIPQPSDGDLLDRKLLLNKVYDSIYRLSTICNIISMNTFLSILKNILLLAISMRNIKPGYLLQLTVKILTPHIQNVRSCYRRYIVQCCFVSGRKPTYWSTDRRKNPIF